MPGPLMFDDIPDTPEQAPQPAQGQGPLMFDDIPDTPEQAPAASPASPAAPQAKAGPLMFDDIPDHAASAASPVAVSTSAQPKARYSLAGQDYISRQQHPIFQYDASADADAAIAKAGTLGTPEEISDKTREAKGIERAAIGYYTSALQQKILDPEFRKLPASDRNNYIDDLIESWNKQGLPGGKLNAASPEAFITSGGDKGGQTFTNAMRTYADELFDKGAVGAHAPTATFENKRLVVQQEPDALQSMALSALHGLPGAGGGTLGGIAGDAAGSATGIPGGGIAGGVIGSLAGAYLGEAGVRGLINEYGGETGRNNLERIDLAQQAGDEAHPLASWVGEMASQGAANSTGIMKAATGKGFAETLTPRLGSGLLGAGVEAGSELGRGEDLDPYHIGQAGLSGTVFTKPRFLGEGSVPMSYEGRNWTDTNIPKPELISKVDALLRQGAAPIDVLRSMGSSLPDTLENRQAVRNVSADIRAGRDPAQHLAKIEFRPGGLSVTKVLEAVNNHVSGWEDAPQVQVHDSYDSPSIPENMRDRVGPGTLGWKDDVGEIHIVASQHASPESVTATMFHEGMHAGLVRAYQAGLQDKLIQLYDNANPNMKTALNKMEAEQQENNPDWAKLSPEEQKALVTDEVLATASENGIDKRTFDKAAAWVRGFGRTRLGELGRRIKYSDAEVRQILSTGHDAVSKGSGAAVGPTRYMDFGPTFRQAQNDNINEMGWEPDLVQQPRARKFYDDDAYPDGYQNDNSEGAVKLDRGGPIPAEAMTKDPLEQAYIRFGDRAYELGFTDERRFADRRSKEYKEWDKEVTKAEEARDAAKLAFDQSRQTEFPQTTRNFNTIENPDGGGRRLTLPNPDDVFGPDLGTSETFTRYDGEPGEHHVQTYTPEEARQVIEQRLGIKLDDPGDTRFSRKYSGNFGNDYQGRQDRTENLLKSHFGNFSIHNVKGMMRPLEEYNRITHEDILNAGQELKDQGFDAGIAVAQGAIPDNSGFVVALRDLVRDKLETASEVAGRYRQSGGMRHERELLRAVTDLGQVMAVFDKTASNLGRMLHAVRLRLDSEPSDAGLQRMLDSIRFANGKLDPVAMDQIAQALVSKDPTTIRKSIDRFDPKWKQYGQSLFYNFILGSKAVQLGNVMGNATHIVQKGLGDILGYGVGLGQEAKFRVGDKLGLDVTAPDRAYSDEIMGRLSGLLAGLMNKETYNSHRAFNTAAKEFFVPAGSAEHENKFAAQSIKNLPASLLLEYGTRGLQAGDAFFRTVLEHSAMQGLATREARRLNNGQKPSTEQIADVMASPSRELLSKVQAEADRMLFQEQPSRQAEAFSRFMRNVPGGWLIAPIIKTPSNIGRTAFETFDPTGRVTKRNRDALKAGGPEANRVRGQQLLAGALWAGALYLMNEDLLHGGGPSNPAARAQWLESHVPYTIGNTETGFFPLRGISPIGDGLSTIADMREAVKYGTKDPDTTKADKALMVAAGLSDAFLSNSFMSSVTNDLERGMQPTMQNLMGTLVQSAASVPLYSQIKKEQDPFVRDTSNEGFIAPSLEDKASLMDNPMMEHYFGGVKGRDELPVRRDIFGAPILADHPTSSDPIAQEVGRLVNSTGRAVIPSFARTVNGKHVPNDMYNSFMAIAGPQMREAVSGIMNDPRYKKALTDKQRVAIFRDPKSAAAQRLNSVHERLRKQLEQMMLDRNPRFEDSYISDDTKQLMTLPGE